MTLRVVEMAVWVLLVPIDAAIGQQLADPELADPPARVARLNYLDGWVSFRPADLPEWAAAELNFPLTTGGRLWTDREAHAGLRIGAMAIHMAPWTALSLMRLDDRVAQLSVAEGTVYLRIPRLDEGELIEIDTPNGAVTVLQPGAYRVDVDPLNDATSVTVRSGEAEVSGNGAVTVVRAGKMLQLVANAYVAGILDALVPDAWEDWCANRDRLLELSLATSESYVDAEMEGAEELASYGDWSTDASYGDVWTPRKPPAGWAPYRCGHWAYVAPWGWTWVDDTPWGFTTSHYGRWARLGFRWAWVPGHRLPRPVYSPAMVAFVASGAARAGRVTAWIPLAPGEAYRPSYRASDAYIRRINQPNARYGADTTLSVTSYVNRTHGIAVSRETFEGGRPVAPVAGQIPGTVRPTTVEGSPSHASYLGRRTGAAGDVKTPPPQVTERAVIVRHELPPEVRPAAPIRGAIRMPVESAVSPAPGTTASPERANRQEAQPEPAAPVYLSLPQERTPQREERRAESAPPPSPSHEEPRHESAAPPPQRHEQSRHEPAPPPPQRHEEARQSAPPPPQRHEETRHETAAPPPQRHEESRQSAPPPPPQRHEESRPSVPPPSSRGQDDSRSSSSSSSRKQ